MSPKICTAIPASTNDTLVAGNGNKKSAATTIPHPAAKRRSPVSFILYFSLEIVVGAAAPTLNVVTGASTSSASFFQRIS